MLYFRYVMPFFKLKKILQKERKKQFQITIKIKKDRELNQFNWQNNRSNAIGLRCRDGGVVVVHVYSLGLREARVQVLL